MPNTTNGKTITLIVQAGRELLAWQNTFNATIAKFPGLISLEILSPIHDEKPIWTFILRFSKAEHSNLWLQSKEHQNVLTDLRNLVGAEKFQEVESHNIGIQNGVTEVFVTQVSLEKEEAFRSWIAKMHEAEVSFPGYRGMYVQAPRPNQGSNWLTFLHFDTAENLDFWLLSPERQKILQELNPLISSLESHRVISPYVGWFTSLQKEGHIPSAWKQSMLVLLVLFPMVMLQLQYMPLLTGNFNNTLATFINNTLSVTLLGYPLVPFAIYCFDWWLGPKGATPRINLLGILIILSLYLLSIVFFWNWL